MAKFIKVADISLNKLEPCNRCGGRAKYDVEYVDTEFGRSRFVALRCENCNARTAMYMCEKDDPKIIKIIEDLWNRGRTVKDG